MGSVDVVYVWGGIVALVILLCRLDGKFTKVEKELGELRKRMDALLREERRMEDRFAETVSVEETVAVKETVTWEGEPEATPPVKEEGHKEDVLEEMPSGQELQKATSAEEETPMVAECTVETGHDVLSQTVKEERTCGPTVLKRERQRNYEKFVGENLFGKIGILVFVAGVGFFVKYAIDKNWIDETFRTVLGFLTGVALLAVAGRLQKHYRTFSSLLAGGAFAVFYLTVGIAFHSYHLFSQTAAFLVLVAVTLLMSVLAVVYDRRELAVVALVGGFLAPFIAGDSNGSYLALFTYVAILNLGMFGLSFLRKWSELPVVSFVFTVLITMLFVVADDTVLTSVVSRRLYCFATLFYFTFLLPVFSILRVGQQQAKSMSRALMFVVITNNFVYLFTGLFLLKYMALPFRADGCLSLMIALVNAGLLSWLWKKRNTFRLLADVQLGLLLTFVSITVPIQLDGHFVTLLWASEMVLLLWLYARSGIRLYELSAKIVMGLTAVSYGRDVFATLCASAASGRLFLNSSFSTSLFVGLAVGACALLMERHRLLFVSSRRLPYKTWNPLLLFLSVGILYATFMLEFDRQLEGAVRSGMLYLFTAVSALAVCCAFKQRFPVVRHAAVYWSAVGGSVLLYVFAVWNDRWEEMSFLPAALRWLTAAAVIATTVAVARLYSVVVGMRPRLIVCLNLLAVIVWVTMVRFFLWQVGVEEFATGLSLSLSAAGLVQMGLGMRLRQKTMRMVSLFTFGVVLLKLVLVDLWVMPALGKIVVFILLGLALLALSFLYQKLRDVLFKDDEGETD